MPLVLAKVAGLTITKDEEPHKARFSFWNSAFHFGSFLFQFTSNRALAPRLQSMIQLFFSPLAVNFRKLERRTLENCAGRKRSGVVETIVATRDICANRSCGSGRENL